MFVYWNLSKHSSRRMGKFTKMLLNLSATALWASFIRVDNNSGIFTHTNHLSQSQQISQLTLSMLRCLWKFLKVLLLFISFLMTWNFYRLRNLHFMCFLVIVVSKVYFTNFRVKNAAQMLISFESIFSSAVPKTNSRSWAMQ